MPDRLDCIVIGYNDTSITQVIDNVEHTQGTSGTYRHFLANTLNINGERKKYSTFLNDMIQKTTNINKDLYAAKMPNLGACYLVHYLLKRNFQAELINSFNHNQDELIRLLEQNPISVAITTTFYVDPSPIREIINLIRKYNTTTKIIVGGPHIFNICQDEPIKLQDYLFGMIGGDIYIFSGEGEESLGKVCEELRKDNPDLSQIPNLTFTRSTGKKKVWERTEVVVESSDMNENSIDWSIFDKELIIPTVQTRTARSCAFKCAFCRYPFIAGDLTLTDLSVIEKEFDYLHSTGVKSILFIDDTFNIPLSRFKELCKMMIRKQYNFNWYSYFRCANADDEAFDLAAASGCTGVFLGIESGSKTVLKAMNKGATPSKYKYGINALNSRGIMTYGSFIIGHPGETEETAMETLAFIEDSKPTFYCLETFFMDDKVPISKKREEFGIQNSQYSWKHNGMDWIRASEIVELGYKSIKNSILLPLYSFDLWSIAYLIGEGISVNTIKNFLEISSEILTRGLNTNQPIDITSQEERLIALFHQDNYIMTENHLQELTA